MTRLELLAPARTADIGIAAIRCGADAVYIGGPAFGARAAAGNSIEDIERLCREASLFGVKIFVTVNTLARNDEELGEAVEMICSMRGKGIHAFIIQDCKLLPLLAARGPWKEQFHASTQCAIRTPERAVQLAGLGFSRLILEREFSLEEIKAIREAVPPEVELECFVHGALCVCYSGDCYLSEHLTGRSANRGECAQPCRNLYNLVDKDGKVLVEGKPLLSLKDLKLLGRIPALAEAGVVSFKIEGRLKNESYVKNVVRAYSIALDSFIASQPGRYCRASCGTVTGGFVPDLDKTFNRGYTSLFIDGIRGSWASGDAAKGMGELLGTVGKVNTAHGAVRRPGGRLGERQGERPDTGQYGGSFIELNPVSRSVAVHNGDGLCVISPNGEVAGFRADRIEGRRIYCKLADGVREGFRIWRNLDTAFEKELATKEPERIVGLALKVKFTEEGADFEAVIENGKSFRTSYPFGAPVVVAENQDRMSQMIYGQLGKTSGAFSFSVTDISSEGTLPLLPAGTLNGFRRNLAEKAAEIMRSGYEGCRGTWNHTAQASTTGEGTESCCTAQASTTGEDTESCCTSQAPTTCPDAGSAELADTTKQADSTELTDSTELADFTELTHPRRDGELMRSRYCILHELGKCLKTPSGRAFAKNGLLLKNNGKLIPLHFDCKNCEMVLLRNI